jgi:hypothetical protein
MNDATSQALESNPDLEAVPSGAFALAGVAVGLLVIAWFAMYLFVFIPRGPVG